MPELDHYDVDSANVLADFTSGENFQTPMDTYLKARFERGINYGITKLGLDNVGIWAADHTTYKDYTDAGDPIPNLWMSSQEAKDKYGIKINAAQRISDLAAKRISELKAQDQTREDIINHASPDFTTQALGFGSELAANLLDPISIGAMFVPVVGEARGLMLMEKFGPTVGRLIAGGAEGLVGNALLEPFTYGFANRLNYDYDIYDSFLNIAAGGIIGAGLHASIGKVGDVFGFSEWSRHVERGRIQPETHHTALRTALGQALQDQNVNVSPIVRAAILEGNPNLDAISAVRMIKSAEESAAVFQRGFDSENFLYGYYDDVRSLLTDTERRVMDATSTREIVEGQIQLGSDINSLTKRLSELQQVIEEAPPSARPSLTREMARVSDELDQKQGLLDNLLEARQIVDEELNRVNAGLDDLNPVSRASLGDMGDDTQLLNIEKYRDENLEGVDFSRVKGEIDKALLRKAVLTAQDLNKLDSIDYDGLVDLATHQGSLENRWYYDTEVERQMDENIQAAPKNYDDTDAQKALDDIIAKLDPEALPDMKSFDENIQVSKSFGEALRSAAGCILAEML